MLNIPTIDVDSIKYAINRLNNFNSVNQARDDRQDRIEGLKLYCASIGLDEETVNYLFECLGKMFNEKNASIAFLGALIGLAITEYQSE